MKLNEQELKTIVYDSVKNILKEGIFYRTRPEGKPKSASDVIKGNGWTARVVSKDANSVTIRCYTHSDSLFGMDDPLPFDELVEDLNIYYEDKGSPCRAEGQETDKGAFITVRRTR
jgi:hypothetical protein